MKPIRMNEGRGLRYKKREKNELKRKRTKDKTIKGIKQTFIFCLDMKRAVFGFPRASE